MELTPALVDALLARFFGSGLRAAAADVLAWAEYREELRSPTWRLPAAEQARIREADRAQDLAWPETHR